VWQVTCEGLSHASSNDLVLLQASLLLFLNKISRMEIHDSSRARLGPDSGAGATCEDGGGDGFTRDGRSGVKHIRRMRKKVAENGVVEIEDTHSTSQPGKSSVVLVSLYLLKPHPLLARCP
jgi:hypothetical protein